MNKFYHYSQNNSGGSFTGDYHHYVIEAKDSKEADSIATNNGIYFNGVEEGSDCDCCGDRWSSACYQDGDDQPSIYDKKHNPNGKEYLDWSLKSVIIYKDGREEIFKV